MASSLAASPADLQLSYAGVGRRVAAHLIDTLIVFTLTLVAVFLILWLHRVGVWSPPTFPTGPVDPLMLWEVTSVGARLLIIFNYFVALGVFYSGFLQASPWQATIGKRLLNVYVTDIGGRRLGLIRSLGRSFAKEFLNFFCLGVLSVALIGGSRNRQAVHDLVVKTLVVNGHAPEDGSLEFWRLVVAFGTQILWLVVTYVAVFRSLQ